MNIESQLRDIQRREVRERLAGGEWPKGSWARSIVLTQIGCDLDEVERGIADESDLYWDCEHLADAIRRGDSTVVHQVFEHVCDKHATIDEFEWHLAIKKG